MKLNHMLALGIISMSQAFGQAQPGINEAWEGFSDPDIVSSGFTHKFTDLPLESRIDNNTKSWSGHYWPSREGSINNRWNSPRKEGFDYSSPSKEAVVRMSTEELATLSPSEKFDLFNGRYSFPLKANVNASASKLAPDWAGICHGWAPASTHHNEPTPKTLKNPDGVLIPFGSADIKALLSYYYAFYHEVNTSQVGLRCFFGRWMGGARGCNQDLNAGAFHIVIANKLGIEKTGLMMDVDRYRQVWNQPIVGYKSAVVNNLPVSNGAAKSAVREIRVTTELFYVDESDPSWNVGHGTEEQKIESRELQYRLELNAEGNIVGGEWESAERPDFLWNKPKAASFGSGFERLVELLND